MNKIILFHRGVILILVVVDRIIVLLCISELTWDLLSLWIRLHVISNAFLLKNSSLTCYSRYYQIVIQDLLLSLLYFLLILQLQCLLRVHILFVSYLYPFFNIRLVIYFIIIYKKLYIINITFLCLVHKVLSSCASWTQDSCKCLTMQWLMLIMIFFSLIFNYESAIITLNTKITFALVLKVNWLKVSHESSIIYI